MTAPTRRSVAGGVRFRSEQRVADPQRAALPYVVHIDDYPTATAKGWNGALTDHTELPCYW